jgi:hypothetical protein
MQIYAAPLVNGSRGVVMLNRHQGGDDRVYRAITLTVFWEQLGYPPGMKVMGLNPLFTVSLELWSSS